MKTTDLILENQKVLNALQELQELLLQSKKNVDFLATKVPEIRALLESTAESLQTGVDILENQIVFNRDTRNKFAKEVACKNQAYDFILTERLLNRFKLFCSCYPVSTYDKKRVLILLTSKAQRKGGNNQVAAFLFILPCSYSI